MVSVVLLRRRNVSCQMLLLLQMLGFLPQTQAAPSLTTEQLDMGVVSFFFFFWILSVYGSEVFLHITESLYCILPRTTSRHLFCLIWVSPERPVKRTSVVFSKYLLWMLTSLLCSPIQEAERLDSIYTAWLKLKMWITPFFFFFFSRVISIQMKL